MRRSGTGRSFGAEGGFTLVEVLVTVVLMVVVLFALYGIFDSTIRVFKFGNDRIEAVQNARVALERMERELRMAYPRNPDSGNDALFNVQSNRFTGSATPVTTSGYYTDSGRITFGNDLDDNGRVGDATTSLDETIVYWANNDGYLKRCYRCDGIRFPGNASPPLAYLGETGSLSFRYFTDEGRTEVPATAPGSLNDAQEISIDMVRISVTVDTGSAGRPNTQTLTTDVYLRNRT